MAPLGFEAGSPRWQLPLRSPSRRFGRLIFAGVRWRPSLRDSGRDTEQRPGAWRHQRLLAIVEHSWPARRAEAIATKLCLAKGWQGLFSSYLTQVTGSSQLLRGISTERCGS